MRIALSVPTRLVILIPFLGTLIVHTCLVTYCYSAHRQTEKSNTRSPLQSGIKIVINNEDPLVVSTGSSERKGKTTPENVGKR